MQFSDQDRQAFRYFNGVEQVYADPLPAYRLILLMTHGKPGDLHRKVFATDPATGPIEEVIESCAASDQLSALIREVFKMVPFDPKTGQGARDEHCWVVWNEFYDYMLDLKKKAETSPTTSSPSATQPASSPPTPNTSG